MGGVKSMVSSGEVLRDSQEFGQIPTKYISQIEDLSSSWKGSSHDNLWNQASEFCSQMQQITSSMNSFQEAVSYYESYRDIKEKYQEYVSIYNQILSSDDHSSLGEYKALIEECEARMKELALQIEEALAAASSFSMDSTSTTTGETTSTSSSSSSTEEFVSARSPGILGHFLSSISGKEHTVYNQNQIKGWRKNCNRAAAASIASGFASDNKEAVTRAQESPDGIGYNSEVTNQYFSQFGLNATVNKVDDKYDTVKSKIISDLNQGKYVMFDLSKPNVVGESGQRWSYRRHWLSILDIKKTGPGENDYAIFISDSAHGGSSADHGLGAGWYSINEFDGKEIANLTTISS